MSFHLTTRALLKNLCIVLILIGFQNQSFAQPEARPYKNALEAFYEEEFYDAILLFNEVLEINPKYKDAPYKLEICSLVLKENREKSLDVILKYGESIGSRDKFYNYWMGRIYANRYLFPEAVASWEKFLSQKAYKSKEIVEETRDFIKETENHLAFFDNTDNYEVHPLESPINSKYAEMSPVYFEDKKELLFASAKGSNGEDFKIYHSTREGYGWSEATEVSSLGTFERSTANIEVVNEDGKLFLFDDKNNSLSYSEPKGKSWSIPLEFDSKISSKNLASHFYINTHEDRIIFVNKHKRNGLDLFETFKDANTGKWTKPVPMSDFINSDRDEESPYLSPDEKTLYFSSKRSGGVGGYDVYISKFDDNTKAWKEPENMGWPINSPDDDIHFKMNDDQKSGYFISNRIYSLGDYDIFFFWEIEKAFIEGRVINAINDEVVDFGEIRFHPSQYLIEYFRSPIDENGKFRTEIISNEEFRVEIINGLDTLGTDTYEIHDAKGQTITHIQDFYVILDENATEEQIAIYKQKVAASKVTFAPPTVAIIEEKEEEVPIVAKTPTEEEIPSENETITEVEELGNKYRTSNKMVLKNIYFDFGTSQLTKESNEMLNRLYQTLKKNPEMSIEISGHTDNIGEKEVNQWLSENRAKAVKKWLESKGIDKKRLIAKGYGETRPLASNDDEKDGRELNRRIEILIIE